MRRGGNGGKQGYISNILNNKDKKILFLKPALSLPSASRAKLSMINTMSKIRGQEKGPGYPQAEALLAEAMLKFGRELGDDCNFGKECSLTFSFMCSSVGILVPVRHLVGN